MNIIWSHQAKSTYENIIDDLFNKWNIEIVLDFEHRTNNLLDHLKLNKQLCPISKYKKLRKCVIHKNISLVYKSNRKTIEIITFLFNKENHAF